MAMLVKHRFDGSAVDLNGSLHGTPTDVVFERSLLHGQDDEAVFNGTTSKIVSGLQMAAQTAAIFTLWMKPISGTGYVMGQYDGSTEGVGLQLDCTPTAIGTNFQDQKLLLHFNRSYEDTSPLPVVMSNGSSTRPPISTAQAKFGPASLDMTAAGTYLFATSTAGGVLGTGDFTIDFWIYRTVADVAHYLYDQRATNGNGVYPTIYIAADNTLRYYVSSADRITGATTVSTNQWVHIALVRSAGSTVLYLDGVAQGSAYTDANSYLAGASRPILGTNGNTLANDNYTGYLDEVRVTSYAAWTTGFTPPTEPYPNIGVAQARVRAKLNTLSTAYYPIPRDHYTPVTLSYDTGVLSLYIGGELKETLSATVTWPSTPITFGCLNAGTDFVACRLAAFAAWDVAASETAALYLSAPSNLSQITDITCPPTAEDSFTSDTTSGLVTVYSGSTAATITYDAGNEAMNFNATAGGNNQNHIVWTGLTPSRQFTFEIEMEQFSDPANRDHWGLTVALGDAADNYLPYFRIHFLDRAVLACTFFISITAGGGTPTEVLLHDGYTYQNGDIRTARLTWDFERRHLVFYIDNGRAYEASVPADLIPSWVPKADALSGHLPAISLYNGSMRIYSYKYWTYVIPGAPFGDVLSRRMRYPSRSWMNSQFVNPWKGYHPYGNNSPYLVTDGWMPVNRTNHPKGQLTGNLSEQYFADTAKEGDAPHSFGAIAWMDPTDGVISKYADNFGGVNTDLTKNGKIQGTITEVPGSPVSRLVCCFTQDDRRLIRSAWSGQDGSYLFVDLHMDRLYTVVVYDYTGTYNAVIADKVSPELNVI